MVGLDAAADVVAQAQEHADGLGLENLHFEVGDLSRLGFPDASFDVVHLHQVLQHLGDPVAALVELRRVLRPDGVLAARDSDYGAFTWAPADPLLDRWLELYLASRAATATMPDRSPAAGHAHEAGFSGRECRARRGPTPTPRRGRGGAGCGPTGCASRASPSRPSSTA